MQRKILVASFMLLALIALAGSPGLSASAVEDPNDPCYRCHLQCVDEAATIFRQCWNGGGSYSFCTSKSDGYISRCESMFCQGGGLCSGGSVGPVLPVNNGNSVGGFDEVEACLFNAHQARQECGDTLECVEEYNDAVNACVGE